MVGEVMKSVCERSRKPRLAPGTTWNDEDTKRCGVTAEIAARITEKTFGILEAPVRRVAAADIPIPGGIAEERCLPQRSDILAVVEAVMS